MYQVMGSASMIFRSMTEDGTMMPTLASQSSETVIGSPSTPIHTYIHTYIHTFFNFFYVCMYVCRWRFCCFAQSWSFHSCEWREWVRLGLLVFFVVQCRLCNVYVYVCMYGYRQDGMLQASAGGFDRHSQLGRQRK